MSHVKHQIVDEQIAEGPRCVRCGEAAPDCDCPRPSEFRYPPPRRFILLGGRDYEAAGGFNDFICSRLTLDEVIIKAEAMFLTVHDDGRQTKEIDWWHVWDTETNTVVAAIKDDPGLFGYFGLAVDVDTETPAT